MGGCASKPRELDDPKNESAAPAENPAESDVVVKEVEVDASAQKDKAAEVVTEPAVKEAPLLDLSETTPVAEKAEVFGLAPEITELATSDAPKADVIVVEKDEAPVTEEKIDDKTREAKKPQVVADANVST